MRVTLTLLLLLVISFGAQSQTKEEKAKLKAEKELQKFEKSLLDPEEAYAEGNYKSAKSGLAKARKKINAKLGVQNGLSARMYILDAR
jgi:hypothetical protein